MVRGKVLDDHKGETVVDRYVGEELLESVKATGRRADPDDGNYATRGRWTFFFRAARFRVIGRFFPPHLGPGFTHHIEDISKRISHELNEFNELNSLNSFNSWLIPVTTAS